MQIFRKQAVKLLQIALQAADFTAIAGFTVSENKGRGFLQCNFIQLGSKNSKATENFAQTHCYYFAVAAIPSRGWRALMPG